MTHEYFITLLSDYLNKKKTKRVVSINWQELLGLAKFHELAGIVFYQCKDFIPDEYKSQFEQYNASTVYYYANRMKEETQILQRFREAGISCFIIKGSAIAAYYPIPAYRTMGDSDIVVDDLNKAHDVLMASGYTCKTQNAVYFKKDMLFEIHDHITHRTKINSDELVLFFNNYWDYVKGGELDWSFHLLFLILHLRSHFYHSGVGIRQFMDVAAVIKYNDKLDWSFIEEELKEFDMWSFAQKVFDLNYRWFGIKAPVAFASVDDSFFKESTLELITGGVFGGGENFNRRLEACESNRPMLGGIRRIGGMVFVPYKDMIRMPQYKFLVGRPCLLPFAWIYRIGLTIKRSGIKRTAHSIQSSLMLRADIKRQKDYIDKWSR